MRSLSTQNNTALAQRAVVPRDFLRIVARNRDTNAPEEVGFWSDISNVSALVINPDTGISVSRNFYGAGSLISISDVPAVVGVVVHRVTVRMSQLHGLVEQAVRLYDVKQARVEIYRGLLSVDTRQLVAPAFPRFVGFVDEVEIRTPSENEDGYIELQCASHTQEMIRYNPDTRSHASQTTRAEGDAFYKDVAVVGDWQLFWGGKRGKIDADKPKKPHKKKDGPSH